MKTLYEPADALEAHMLHDFLRQEGITTRIDGAYLQGGVGELPASGLVRLRVEEADYERARAIIKKWEATEAPSHAPTVANPATRVFGAALGGVLIGAIGALLLFQVPTEVDGSDHNHDGVLDERWKYSAGGSFLGGTMDRNFDRKIDYRSRTNLKGELVSADSDDDFDGSFETRIRFKNGSFEYVEVDTDADSLPNMKTYYEHGIALSTEYINPLSGLPVRVERYRLGELTTADVDTNLDGILDKRYTYTKTGLIARETSIQQAVKPDGSAEARTGPGT